MQFISDGEWTGTGGITKKWTSSQSRDQTFNKLQKTTTTKLSPSVHESLFSGNSPVRLSGNNTFFAKRTPVLQNEVVAVNGSRVESQT